MLEEKHDNLPDADGNQLSESTDNQNTIENKINSDSLPASSSEDSTSENQTILDAIATTNAEESEDETLKERHDIPMLDYEALDMETLVNELKQLVTTEKVMSIKEHVEEIKKAFLAKYYHLLEEKKEEFQAENTDPNETFEYHFPLKSKFDQYYTLYKENKNRAGLEVFFVFIVSYFTIIHIYNRFDTNLQNMHNLTIRIRYTI